MAGLCDHPHAPHPKQLYALGKMLHSSVRCLARADQIFAEGLTTYTATIKSILASSWIARGYRVSAFADGFVGAVGAVASCVSPVFEPRNLITADGCKPSCLLSLFYLVNDIYAIFPKRSESTLKKTNVSMSVQDQVILRNFDTIFSLEGKVAVVTGGSRGLGLHAASGFLQAGCSKVYITSRKAKACEEAAAALNALPNKRPGAVAISVPADISKLSEIERLVAEVKKTTDHVDILFANAGASWGAPFDTYPESSFQKVMDLNVKSVFYAVQKFAPLLETRGTLHDPSRVIVTASTGGLGTGDVGDNAGFAYSASKAAVIHLAKNLALNLGPRRIATNAIAPGFFLTKMSAGLIEIKGGAARMAAQSPNGRLGEPEDIAGLVVFLSSRAAAHINGAVITTDGGAMLKGKL